MGLAQMSLNSKFESVTGCSPVLQYVLRDIEECILAI